MKNSLPKSLRTPLRYPGGKSRATKTLFEFFPPDIHEYREPFLGGGSMAIEFTRRYPDIPVIVSDFDPLVYNFWKVLRDDGKALLDKLLHAKLNAKGIEGHRTLFQEARTLLSGTITNELESAYAFFIVNKCGFSGLMSGGFSEQASQSNFSKNNILNLEHYTKHIQNWSIQNVDAPQLSTDRHQVLKEKTTTFLYALSQIKLKYSFGKHPFEDDTGRLFGKLCVSNGHNFQFEMTSDFYKL